MFTLDKSMCMCNYIMISLICGRRMSSLSCCYFPGCYSAQDYSLLKFILLYHVNVQRGGIFPLHL